MLMMTNLFSIFDPSLSLFSLSWLTSIYVLLLFPFFYWLGGFIFISSHIFLSSFFSEVNYALLNPSKGVYLFVGGIFLTLIGYNFLALFPHVFSVTSHMLVTLPFSYSFWLGVIIFSWVGSLKHFLSHLIPLGTPLALLSFMSLVEMLSNFIRPLALTFRLTANMMAGHLLMSLIGGALIFLPVSLMILGSSVQIFLVFMELGVSIIQAYVFSTLLILYISEGKNY